MRRTPVYPMACALLALSACSDHAGIRTPLGLVPTDDATLVIPVLATTDARTNASIARAMLIEEDEPGGGWHPPAPPPASGPGGGLFAGAGTLDDSLARLTGIPTSIDGRLRTYFQRIDDNTTAWMLEYEAWVRAHKVTVMASSVITRTAADFTTTNVDFPALEPRTWFQDVFSTREMFDTFMGRELHFIHTWRRTLPVPICGLTSNSIATATSVWARIPTRDLLPGEWGHRSRESGDLKRTDPCGMPCPPADQPPPTGPPNAYASRPHVDGKADAGGCGDAGGGGVGGGGPDIGGGHGGTMVIETCYGNHVYDSAGNYLYSEILYCTTQIIHMS